MTKVENEMVEMDIRDDPLVLWEGWDRSGVGIAGLHTVQDGSSDCILVLGHLRIKMTLAQEERLRRHYENT